MDRPLHPPLAWHVLGSDEIFPLRSFWLEIWRSRRPRIFWCYICGEYTVVWKLMDPSCGETKSPLSCEITPPYTQSFRREATTMLPTRNMDDVERPTSDPLLVTDYRCEDRNKFGDWRGDIGAIRQVLTCSSTKSRSSTPKKKKKNEPFSLEMHLKIHLISWVGNCKILNQVVESQLFTSLWNRYHWGVSDIDLIQISTFFSFLFHY